MKKTALFIIVLLGLSLINPHSSFSKETKPEVSKKQAFIFMQKGMYNQAIAVWEAYTEKTTDAEAEFELGNCYVMKGQMSLAEERYRASTKLDHKYGYKIGSSFRDAGELALKNGLPREACLYYFKAVEYEEKLRMPIAEELYKEGERLLRVGMLGFEDDKFVIAAGLSPPHREKICKLYIELGDRTEDEKCAFIYMKAGAYSTGANERVGNRLVNIAKRLAKQAGRDNEATLFKKAAAVFIGPQAVENLLPERILYTERKENYPFELKAGEQTDHWVVMKEGVSFQFYSEKGSMYKIRYKNGNEIRKGEPHPTGENNEFKIIAINDSSIEIEVTIEAN